MTEDNRRKKSTWNTPDTPSPAPRHGQRGASEPAGPPQPAEINPDDATDMPYAALHAGQTPYGTTDADPLAAVLADNAATPIPADELVDWDDNPVTPVTDTEPGDTEPSEPAGTDLQVRPQANLADVFNDDEPEVSDETTVVVPTADRNPFTTSPQPHADSDDVLSDLFDDEPGADTLPAVPQHNDDSEPVREMFVGYTLSDEQYKSMMDVLGLALSGDPELQHIITSFDITQDPDIDLQQFNAYKAAIENVMPRSGIRIANPVDYPIVLAAAYDQLLGLGPLGPLWRDPDITDIMVTGPDRVIVDKNGFLHRTDITFRDLKHLHETGRRLSTKVDDRAVNRTNPLVTVQLNKARVQLAWPPVARSGGNITIRKHRRNLTLPELLERGALSPDMAAMISDAVISQSAILVSGGTATGKTTYLNVASGFIPDIERVIVIEDAAELELTNSFVDYYLTKQRASADDEVTIDFKQLLQATLRMRPDRIIVGEILSPEGADAMLTASYTGHDGTMSTIHANNPTEALHRLGDLVREATGAPEDTIMKKVLGTFELLIHVDKNKQTGIRYISEISTVTYDGIVVPLFRGTVGVSSDPVTGALAGTTRFERVHSLGADTSLAKRMKDTGIDTSPWEKDVT